jgi:hypothetical protein
MWGQRTKEGGKEVVGVRCGDAVWIRRVRIVEGGQDRKERCRVDGCMERAELML